MTQTRSGRRRYGDPRRTGRPPGRRPLRGTTSGAAYAAAGFVLLLAGALVWAVVLSAGRGDREFDTFFGWVMAGGIVLVLVTFAVLLVLPNRLLQRWWRLWDGAVFVFLLGTGLALVAVPADFASTRGGLRAPDTPTGARVLGVVLLVGAAGCLLDLIRRGRTSRR